MLRKLGFIKISYNVDEFLQDVSTRVPLGKLKKALILGGLLGLGYGVYSIKKKKSQSPFTNKITTT